MAELVRADMTTGAGVVAGMAVEQHGSAKGTAILATGAAQCIGIAGTVRGVAMQAVQSGIAKTYRSDLAIGTTYYAAAGGTLTATPGALAQRVGAAVSPSEILLDLGYI
jgi:CheY-specific phosphatase CheX